MSYKIPQQNNTHVKSYICTIIFSALIGTYLDLFLVGKGYYTFPVRPFPAIFSIDIFFALVVLPVSTFFILYIFNRINRLFKIIISLFSSIIMAILENVFEQLGYFVHSDQWMHSYSIFGYLIFIIVIWNFYQWLNK